MKSPLRKTIASASAIAIVLALTALVRLWAAPQFGLNLKAVELHEKSEPGPPAVTADGALRCD